MQDKLIETKKIIDSKIKKRKKINKENFVRFLVKEGIFKSKKEGLKNVMKVIEGLEKALEKGYDIQFTGFGKFNIRTRIIRGSSDKLTGKSTNTVAIIPTLEPGKNLKEKVRKAILKDIEKEK